MRYVIRSFQVIMVILIGSFVPSAKSFSIMNRPRQLLSMKQVGSTSFLLRTTSMITRNHEHSGGRSVQQMVHSNPIVLRKFPLYATGNDGESSSLLSESDQFTVGIVGVIASLIVFYSEYTLKMTGCGLPAGPFGLYGAMEGISYLIIVAIAAFSAYTKVSSGSGLPAGPVGLLGAAEGLAYLSILTGLVVLGFQIIDYGYIPNAVPMEGGMCT